MQPGLAPLLLSLLLCICFILSLRTVGHMAPVVLALILYILIPQRKLGFKVFSVPNPKPPGQTTISGPSICLGSSD